MTDAEHPPELPAPAGLPGSPSPGDALAAFAALFPGLEERSFRLGGLRNFSGVYRLVEVDDVDNAVIVTRERDGQRLGLGIADFLDAYRRGHNERVDRSAR